MTTHDVFFVLAGLVTAGAAVRAVTTKQLLHAALWLVVSLGALSGCYLVLGAELVALVQLIVYVGAIVVLVIFALMLTRAPTGPTTAHDTSPLTRLAGLVVAAGTGGLVAAVLISAYAGRADVRSPGTEALATRLFGTWVWPFELLSLLLLVGLVAALAMSRLQVATTPEDLAGEER